MTNNNETALDQDCTNVEIVEIELQEDIYHNCCHIVQF